MKDRRQSPAAQSAASETAAAARAVLRRHCWRSHSGEGSEGGDFDALRIDDLKESGLVSAGDPEASHLFERIAAEELPPPQRIGLNRHPLSGRKISAVYRSRAFARNSTGSSQPGLGSELAGPKHVSRRVSCSSLDMQT